MRLLLTLMIALLTLNACNKEESPQQDSTLTGEWNFWYAIEIDFASGRIAKTDVLKFSDKRHYSVLRDNQVIQSGVYAIRPGINGYSKVTFSSNNQHIYYVKKTDTGIYIRFDRPADTTNNPGWWLGKR